MEVKNVYNAIIAEKIICNFEQGGIEGRYFDTTKSMFTFLKDFIPKGSLVSWGGSITLGETGILEFLRKGNFKVLDREVAAAESQEKLMQLYVDAFASDYYFTSTNAITMDGKLVNIDGRGNRVAAMSFGPKNVIVVAGMNKIVANEQEAISRIRNYAAPLNAIRLSKKASCVSSGRCDDCFESGCICSFTVITRRSPIKGRIKVFLIGENFGY
ncbi:MAG: lactate utilization protein [Spirochaetaceae bacterium]|nr:lactate utilization protein [Spirochaetaceae bacterium]